MHTSQSLEQICLISSPALTKKLVTGLNRIGYSDCKVFNSVKEANHGIKQRTDTLLMVETSLFPGIAEAVSFAKVARKTVNKLPIIFLVDRFNMATRKRLKSIAGVTLMSVEFRADDLLNAIECISEKQKSWPSSSQTLKQEQEVMALANDHTNTEPLFFKVGDKYKRIDVRQIDYFFAENKLTYAKVGTRKLPTNTQLKSLEKNLSEVFIRCHKKYLINIYKIDSIHLKEDKIQLGDATLPIGYVYRKGLIERLRLLR